MISSALGQLRLLTLIFASMVLALFAAAKLSAEPIWGYRFAGAFVGLLGGWFWAVALGAAGFKNRSLAAVSIPGLSVLLGPLAAFVAAVEVGADRSVVELVWAVPGFLLTVWISSVAIKRLTDLKNEGPRPLVYYRFLFGFAAAFFAAAAFTGPTRVPLLALAVVPLGWTYWTGMDKLLCAKEAARE